MSLAYRITGTRTVCEITLAKPAPIEVRLPVSTSEVHGVTVNGQPAKWELRPGFGKSVATVSVPVTGSALVEVTCAETIKPSPAIYINKNTGDAVTLQAGRGQVVDFHDPQEALRDARVQNGVITGVLSGNAGDHLVFGLSAVGETKQWCLFKIHTTDVQAEKARTAKTDVQITPEARWNQVPMESVFNGDIRTIYQQEYLSPRPDTCSLRLSTDGYSTWQMSGSGQHKVPEITLDNLAAVTDESGHITTGKGVRFTRPEGAKNIVFTSSWDNWPKQISVPVNQPGDAVWFLLCGTTNPMEVRIANAELRMKYADGVVEKLPIVPPFNFWSLAPFGGIDYEYERDGFSLPEVPPATIQLGKNCRAVALGWNLRPGVALESITLETLSDEVIIGLMGVTVMSK